MVNCAQFHRNLGLNYCSIQRSCNFFNHNHLQKSLVEVRQVDSRDEHSKHESTIRTQGCHSFRRINRTIKFYLNVDLALLDSLNKLIEDKGQYDP